MKKSFIFVLCIMFLFSIITVNAKEVNASTIRMTVVFNGSEISQDVVSAVENTGGRIISQSERLGSMQIEGSATLLRTLENCPSVMAVSPAMIQSLEETQIIEAEVGEAVDTTGADLYNRYQWDIKQVTNSGESFGIETGNHNVVVGIVDSGISRNHPALKANLLGGRNFVEAGGTNNDPAETGDPNAYDDRNGHGSHVAGSIAGNGRIMGVAPNVGIRMYRALDAKGSGYTSWIVDGIMAAVDDGVDVISISIGGYDCMGQYWWTDPETGEVYRMHDVADYLMYVRAMKYAAEHGVTVVVSAGNNALDMSNKSNATEYMNAAYGKDGYKFVGATFRSFSAIPGLITVSATGPSKKLASYSNYGAGYISVAAPGGDFDRYPAPDYFTDMCLSSYKETSYSWMAGTSMATPKAAAVAALIIAKYGKIGPTKVSHILYQTCEDIGKIGTDNYYGNGFINAVNAVK